MIFASSAWWKLWFENLQEPAAEYYALAGIFVDRPFVTQSAICCAVTVTEPSPFVRRFMRPAWPPPSVVSS